MELNRFDEVQFGWRGSGQASLDPHPWMDLKFWQQLEWRHIRDSPCLRSWTAPSLWGCRRHMEEGSLFLNTALNPLYKDNTTTWVIFVLIHTSLIVFLGTNHDMCRFLALNEVPVIELLISEQSANQIQPLTEMSSSNEDRSSLLKSPPIQNAHFNPREFRTNRSLIVMSSIISLNPDSGRGSIPSSSCANLLWTIGTRLPVAPQRLNRSARTGISWGSQRMNEAV